MHPVLNDCLHPDLNDCLSLYKLQKLYIRCTRAEYGVYVESIWLYVILKPTYLTQPMLRG